MRLLNFIVETIKGRTIYRILFNWKVKECCINLSGEVIDLAGGGKATYYNYLPKNLKIVKTNVVGDGLDVVIDFNKKLPFKDESVENFFLFNSIYITENRSELFLDIWRCLKSGGYLFLSSPFIANEMPEPHDYVRLTAEGLENELKGANFSDINIQRFGERFSSAVYLLHPFFLYGLVRLPFNAMALMLDKVIPSKIKNTHPAPLGYFCVCKKI